MSWMRINKQSLQRRFTPFNRLSARPRNTVFFKRMRSLPKPASPLRRLLIDTDCGTDDATAILMAFQSNMWDVEAIFAVQGNADVDNVVENVRYISTLIPPGDNTKLYRGCSEPLIRHKQPRRWAGHGPTGLGDVKFNEFDMKEALKCEEKHAVPAMIQLADEQPGLLDMIALGPLTNIALALKLDPSFLGKLKSLWIMGGQESKGNTTALAEYNFRSDPEAAKIVLDAKHAERIRIVTYDCTLNTFVSYEEYDMLSKFRSNKMARFLHRSHAGHSKYRDEMKWTICDAVAMWCMMNEDECEIIDRKMIVEVGGDVARGALAIDHSGTLISGPERTPSKLVRRPPSMASFKQALNMLVGEEVFLTK